MKDMRGTRTKKSKTGIWIGGGIFCVLLIVIASWYAVTFNESRLVVPMEFANYTFRVKDLPMIAAVLLGCMYCLSLAVMLILSIVKNRRKTVMTNTTRSLNPGLGFLGLLGFLGFTGFWTYSVDGSMFPFVFFMFFGFLGFYYEGKMSGTFMDERFRENAARAQLKAYKITFSIIFIALAVFCRGNAFGKVEYTMIAFVIVLSLTLALGIFLSEYLLYRYDYDDRTDENGE